MKTLSEHLTKELDICGDSCKEEIIKAVTKWLQEHQQEINNLWLTEELETANEVFKKLIEELEQC